jgi:adenylate cyclase
VIPAFIQRHRILLICLLFAGLVLLLDYASPVFVRLELMTLDWRFQRRGPRKPGPDVVLVTIDEKSLRELGRFSTWTRDRHARLV